jgi:hypothetical protein
VIEILLALILVDRRGTITSKERTFVGLQLVTNVAAREKKNRQYIYIVENIKFIYTSFDEFFLPVSQQVEMNYIFSDSVRILYLLSQRNCQIV